MSFFTNISHEFRTPLTMISGPISTILKDDELDDKNRHLLSIVNRSINRMLRLVNQILYFNKLDNDAISLHLDYIDIVYEINEIIEIFAINGNTQNIHINTFGLYESFFILLDRDKLEKILTNVLSNAVKFSPSGGNVDIYFDTISFSEACQLFALENQPETEYIKIVVEDEGPGIPNDKLETIFLKYYQVDHNSSKSGYNWGTGIGLYFTKRLISLHHGYIKAENRKDKGIAFTILLPNTPTDQVDKSLLRDNSELSSNKFLKDKIPSPKYDLASDKHPYSILIIDDDVEISAYLNFLLQDEYNIINKYTADSAYTFLEKINPDIILCDVIMPGMSGYEFCQKIKNSEYFSHIPIILLTAKSSVQEQIEGLETGANAYIPKPFEPDYLMAVIKSQLLNVQNMRNLLGNSTKISEADSSFSELDNEFMTKLYELMEAELFNNEINVSETAKKMGMSRTKFYLKIKGLTGESPNIFFRRYKLNRAAELLKLGKYNISEVSVKTGFSTLSHFSISFKNHFGVTPKNYKG